MIKESEISLLIAAIAVMTAIIAVSIMVSVGFFGTVDSTGWRIY